MSIKYQKDKDNIVTLTLDDPKHSTNVINESFTQSLHGTLEKLEAEDTLAGVVLTSAKNTFMAGGDLNRLFEMADPQSAFEISQSIKSLFRRLEKLGSPVVAAINGTVLGGGLELVLACHHRVALDSKKIKIGFPEVNLGLLPGGGGVIRLTRLLGLQEALPYLMEGKQIDPQAAAGAGIIDELAEDNEKLLKKAKGWILNEGDPLQPWDKAQYRMPGGAPTNPRVAQMLAIAPAMLNKKTRGNYPAPQAILNTAVEGAMVDFETALRIESRYFAQVATSSEAKNMIKAFWFQLNQINSGDNRPKNIPPAATNKVGVIGAGMMGHGIAYVSAYSGMDVILKDVSLPKAQMGKAKISNIIEKRVARRRMSAQRGQEILDRIKCTYQTAELDGCDLVIEAVFEDRELKAQVTAETESFLGEQALFASNTSTLPITSLAQTSKRPANFIGLHFFSPVHKMKLVEIICGQQTSPETLAKAFDYVRQINKVPIVVNDSRGFYTSRVFSTYLKEGLALLAEGQKPAAIESAGLQAGMPVGPLALADEVSLNLMMHINQQTKKDLKQEGKEMAAHPADKILGIMVEDYGRSGKAAGAGFYEYPQDGPKQLWPQLTTLFPSDGNHPAQEEVIERLMFVQALETVRCYAEDVVTSVADANIGSIFGWGFAPFKGGTLQYINDYGLKSFIKRSNELKEKYGLRFQTPQLLITLAQENLSF